MDENDYDDFNKALTDFLKSMNIQTKVINGEVYADKGEVVSALLDVINPDFGIRH